jgi:DNA-binding NtrC family response regulator
MRDTPKRRVLLVHDDAHVRESMTMLLNAAGYEVSTSQHGDDALLQLKPSDLLISVEKMQTWTEAIQSSSAKLLGDLRKLSDGLEQQIEVLRESVKALKQA